MKTGINTLSLRIPQSELDEAAQAARLEGSYEDSHDSLGRGLELVQTNY